MYLEILLDADPKRRDIARKSIESIIGYTTKDYTAKKDYPAFGHFIEVETEAFDPTEAWAVINELMQVPGVLDVDPEWDEELYEDDMNLPFQLDMAKPRSEIFGYVLPPPNWFHECHPLSPGTKICSGSF